MSVSTDTSVASFLVAHPELYGHFLHQMDIPFGEKLVRVSFQICSQLWKKYGAFPTYPQFCEVVARHKQFENKKGVRELLVATARDIYNPASHNDITRELVLERIVDSYKAALIDNIHGMEAGNLHEKTLEIGQQIDKLDALMGKQTEDWIFPLSPEALVSPSLLLSDILGPPLPTGLPIWNHWLHGGFRRGESLMFIGVTNHGKTAVLTSLVLDLLRAGFRFVYYMLDSPKHEIYQRVWANLSGVGIEEDRVSSEFDTRLKASVRPEWATRLIYRHWPRHVKTTDDLRRDFRALKRRLFDADIRAGIPADAAGAVDGVGLDSIDCLAARRKVSENWLAAGSVAAEFDGFCKEENVFGIANSQAKISGANMDIIDMKQAAESWGKNHPMTHVIGICRTPQELAHDTGRLYVDKTKRLKCHYLVPIHLNKELMRMTERGEPYYLSASAETAAAPRQRHKLHKERGFHETREEDSDKTLERHRRVRPRTDTQDEDGESMVSAPRKVQL